MEEIQIEDVLKALNPNGPLPFPKVKEIVGMGNVGQAQLRTAGDQYESGKHARNLNAE